MIAPVGYSTSRESTGLQTGSQSEVSAGSLTWIESIKLLLRINYMS